MVRLHFSHVEMTLSLFAELAAHKLPEMCWGEGTAEPSATVGMTKCKFLADMEVCRWEGESRYPTQAKERLEWATHDLLPAGV
jgi:hypothetical protein